MNDEYYMKEALRLASFGCGRTSPNPMVGAVIVANGRVVGAGWHRKAGTEHAEIHALNMAGGLARGSTVYVTLEPCSHTGRTGPCADALIRAGITRAVVAMTDPNPLVSGGGVKKLRAAGIDVSVGLMENEARKLNETFIKWIATRRPFITLKMAMTLDGKIATSSGESKWITGEAARLRGHYMRDENDAIMIGVGAALSDNPSLTARLPDGTGKNPIRVVLDSSARLPIGSALLGDDAPLIVAATHAADPGRVAALQNAGADVVFAGESGRVDIALLLDALGRRGITSLLVEGGGNVHFSMLPFADKIAAFIAPKIIGGREALTAVEGEGFKKLSDAVRLSDITTEIIGDDILITGYVMRG